MSDDAYDTMDNWLTPPELEAAKKKLAISKLTPKQKLVYQAIQENPDAANDDSILLAAVWQKEGWQINEFLHINLKRVSRPETLSRRRRQLHQMGLIEYSEKADKERMQAFVNERERHSKYNLSDALGFDPIKEITDKLTIRQAEPPVFTPYKQTELL